MKKLFSIFAILAAISTLTACNTVNGFGKDVEKVGDKIQDKSAR